MNVVVTEVTDKSGDLLVLICICKFPHWGDLYARMRLNGYVWVLADKRVNEVN